MSVVDVDEPEEKALPRILRAMARGEELGLLLIFLGVTAFFLIVEPSARSPRVYYDLLRELAPNLLAMIGVASLMLAGEFDLSIGSMLAVSGVVTISVFNAADSMWLGIAAGLASGVVVGIIHGYAVTVHTMNSLMATLGSLFALRGFVYVYTDQVSVVDQNGFPAFLQLYQGNLGPIPVPAVIAFVFLAVTFFILRHTEFGRKIYAIGGNESAARVSGIDVERIKFILFVVSGLTAAIAGLLIAAQTGVGYFNAGQGFELIIITAVVLGGVSLAGGEGTLLGATLGVLILGMISKALRLMGVYTTWQLVVVGVALMIAVYFHELRKRLEE